MILVNGEKIRIVGNQVDICTEIGFLIDGLIKAIGETETKEMLKIAYETVIETRKEIKTNKKIKTNKEINVNKLKKELKNHLPKEISKILCDLL